MKITEKKLINAGMDPTELKRFNEAYPRGLYDTPVNLQKAIDQNFDVLWMIEEGVTKPTGKIVVDGNAYYFVAGKLHRETGPAIIFACGCKRYYHRGRLHRVPGRAVILCGRRGGERWINGEFIE